MKQKITLLSLAIALFATVAPAARPDPPSGLTVECLIGGSTWTPAENNDTCPSGQVRFTGTDYPRTVTVDAVYTIDGVNYDGGRFNSTDGLLVFTESMGGVGLWEITVRKGGNLSVTHFVNIVP